MLLCAVDGCGQWPDRMVKPMDGALLSPLSTRWRSHVIDLGSTEECLAEDDNPCAVVDLNDAHGRAPTRSVRHQDAVQAADGIVCRWRGEPELAIPHAGTR